MHLRSSFGVAREALFVASLLTNYAGVERVKLGLANTGVERYLEQERVIYDILVRAMNADN